MRLIYLICFLMALLTGCGQTAAAEATDHAPPADEPVSPPETEYVREDDIIIGEDTYTIRRLGVDDPYMKWPVLDTVEICRNGDLSKPVQVFTDFTYDAEPPLDGALLMEDLNFDGWPDFRIFGYQARIGSGWFYWCWDPQTEEFVLHKEMEDVFSPVVDQAEQTIYSSQLYGIGGFHFSAHQWENGALVEARRFSAEWDEDHFINRWYVRRDGNLRLAQEWRVGDGEILTDHLVAPEAEEYLVLARPKLENQFG